MHTAIASTCILMCCLLSSTAVMAMDNSPTPAPTTLLPVGEPQKAETHTWIDAGAGCLGGAALGTVLPGLGNIIGCIAGGVSVWWMRRPSAR